MVRLVAFDFETKDLSARYDPDTPIWCISFAERRDDGTIRSWVEEWDGYDDTPTGYHTLEDCINDPEVILIAHNASFDVAVARTHGVDIPQGKYHDSLVAAYLTNTGGEHSLEAWGEKLGYEKQDLRAALIAAGHLETNAKKGSEFAIDYSQNQDAYNILEGYCKRDAEVTLLLWEHIWNTYYVNDIKLQECYLNLELPYVEIVIEMENTGIYIDVPELTRLATGLELAIRKKTARLSKLVHHVPEGLEWDGKTKRYIIKSVEYKKGYYNNKQNADRYYTHLGVMCASTPSIIYNHCNITTFNPNSSDHLAYTLMQRGWKPTKYTDSGKPSTESDVLAQLDDPLAKLYTEINELSKLNGTFVRGLLDRSISGVVRGSFNQCLTKTARLSSSNPNLQNLPARTKLGKRVRDCVIAPPGWKLVVGDLSQIELVVLAYYLQKVMGEVRMADAVREGTDLHQANADVWNCTRKDAKAIFAINYGAMAPKLAKTMNRSVEEAQEFIDNINKGMPALQALKETVWGKCRSANGVLRGLFGHVYNYPNVNSEKRFERSAAERESFNCVLQGGAGALFKELTLQGLPIWRQHDACIAFVVHDEAGLYVREDVAQQLASMLTGVFSNNVLLSGVDAHGNDFYVPIRAEFNVGNSWTEAKG